MVAETKGFGARTWEAVSRPFKDAHADYTFNSDQRTLNKQRARQVREDLRGDFEIAREQHHAKARMEMLTGENPAMKAQAEKELAAAMESLQKGESFAARAGRDGIFKATYNSGKGMIKGVGKKGLIVGGVVAGGAALAYLASSWRGERKRASREELQNIPVDAGVPQVMSAQDLAMQQQQTLMGLQPQAGDHANRVLMGRGMAPQMGAAVNPSMDVASDVQSLGPVRT